MEETTKLTRRQKKLNKYKEKLLAKEDIKYVGPLSYRELRIIAWLAFAASSFVLYFSFVNSSSTEFLINPAIIVAASIFGSLSVPLFIVASFGLILSGRRKYSKILMIYGFGFFGVGLGICLLYYRYIDGLFVHLGFVDSLKSIIEEFIKNRIEINVFADLFAFALYHYFINYKPKKIFLGKSRIIFRLCAIIPIAFFLTSYILKILAGLGVMQLPFFVYPFLTTKSPIILLMFLVISFWIKYREKRFLKMGFTKEEYQKFLLTKRNSLSLSVHLVLAIVVFMIIELVFFVVLRIAFVNFAGISEQAYDKIENVLQFGQTLSLFLAIPIILLYSYTKIRKNSVVDIFIPIGGIALSIIVYLECIYQTILYYVG